MPFAGHCLARTQHTFEEGHLEPRGESLFASNKELIEIFRFEKDKASLRVELKLEGIFQLSACTRLIK